MVPDRSELILKCSRKNEDEMGRRLSELEQSMMKDILNLKMYTERLPPGNNLEMPIGAFSGYPFGEGPHTGLFRGKATTRYCFIIIDQAAPNRPARY